ncbi:MAG: hypothetical protein H6660_10675 [Ardenticatenaceae bacterium]|nr:hypothetical protein [Ardenticatenaceae bacterium]
MEPQPHFEDGWSENILQQELFDIYEALLRRDAQLPPAPAYAQFIAWLDAQDLGRLNNFGAKHYAGFGTDALHVDKPAHSARAQVMHMANSVFIYRRKYRHSWPL